MSPPANPRARVGHDFGGRFATSGLEISIRAPAWGATSEAQRRALPERVSIRAPAWGATCIVWMASTMLSFQSTRPRGARHISPSADLTGSVFQSTCPRGARRDLLDDCKMADQFQSTRPRGARPRMSGCRYRTTGFNPRARVGRDTLELMHAQVEAEFQSTRPRGARHYARNLAPVRSQFQSTRPRGARPRVQAGVTLRILVSIHAPAWGATFCFHRLE